ncbi:MAG: metallophosphoesterase [Phycisphaerales bacterium]|nr:metallophosphoesterase [Phycisphaerales bacterium]
MPHSTSLTDPDAVIDLLGRAAAALRTTTCRRGCCDVVPARGRLVATGDLHDNPRHLQALVALARLDESPDHHLVLHELIHGDRLINGVDLSHRMLLRTAGLVLLHPGQVHPLLANHELAQLTGRGVSKGAGNSVELYDDGLEYVFGERWEDVAAALRTFVTAMPLALRSEPDASARAVLCAHSIPSPLTMRHFDAGVLDRELEFEDFVGPSGAAYLMTWGRGQTAEQVRFLAEHWGVTLFCLGHEHVEEGIRLDAERIVRINSDHAHGAALVVDLARVVEPEAAVDGAVRLASVPRPHEGASS